jgi:hypothetical protein
VRQRSNLLLRGLAALVVAMSIAGPAPGHIGGCNVETGAVDPVRYCIAYERRVCERDRVAGRIDDAAYATCLRNLDADCAGRNWPVGCSPSEATTQACLDALVDPNRIHLLSRALPECQAVCPGSGGGAETGGI